MEELSGFALKLPVWCPIPRMVRTLQLHAFHRELGHELQSNERTEADCGWEVFWEGDTNSVRCLPDGLSEDGSTSVTEMLRKEGCFVTSDFSELLPRLCWQGESDCAEALSKRLSDYINAITKIRHELGDLK